VRGERIRAIGPPPSLLDSVELELNPDQRLVFIRTIGGDASWSIGMALFGFALAFLALASHSAFRQVRFGLISAALIEALWGVAFVWARVWANAVGIWGSRSESHAWWMIGRFQAVTKGVARVSLGIGLALLLIEVVEQERVSVPSWSEILLFAVVLVGSALYAGFKGARDWQTLKEQIGTDLSMPPRSQSLERESS
jgi:hypothetical protein